MFKDKHVIQRENLKDTIREKRLKRWKNKRLKSSYGPAYKLEKKEGKRAFINREFDDKSLTDYQKLELNYSDLFFI